MNSTLLNNINYQNNTLNLYSFIAEDIKDILVNIISKYSSNNKQDIISNHINDYINYSILEKNSDLNKLLMDFLSINDNKSSQEIIYNLNSYKEIFNELINIKMNDTNLFDVDYKNKLALAKEDWLQFSDIEKQLFQNKENYAKYLLIYQLDIFPNNLEVISKSLKKFFIVLSENLTKQIEKENNKNLNNSSNRLKNIIKYSKDNYDKIYPSFIKYLECRKNLDNHIIKEIINPITSSIIDLLNLNDTNQIKEIYDYIDLKYTYFANQYFSILFNGLISFDGYNFDNNQIELIEKTLYLEVLYESFKKDIQINIENYTKDINLKDTFSKLDIKTQSLYESNIEYQYLSFFNLVEEKDYKKYLPNIINIIKNSFDDNGNLKLKKLENNKQSKSYIDSIKNGIYSTYNYIMNNKTTVVLGLTTLIACALLYRKSCSYNSLEKNFHNINEKNQNNNEEFENQDFIDSLMNMPHNNDYMLKQWQKIAKNPPKINNIKNPPKINNINLNNKSKEKPACLKLPDNKWGR